MDLWRHVQTDLRWHVGVCRLPLSQNHDHSNKLEELPMENPMDPC